MFYVNLGLNEAAFTGSNIMKKVTFIRHAKSDWGSEFLKDIDRPLNERGYRDAYYTSDWYLRNQDAPGLMMSSPATRALNTGLIFARAMSFNMAHFLLNEGIYEAPAQRLIKIIRHLNDEHHNLMLFGHNPGFTNVCNELAEEMDFENVPTCGIVCFEFPVKKWEDITPKTGKLLYHYFPKDFKVKDNL
jgi:phosphohistidine phosphatase